MNLKIIAVGRLKEDYLREAVEYYSKNIKKQTGLAIVEVPDERVPEHYSASEIERAKGKEGESILSHIHDSSFVFALDIEGKKYSTLDFQQAFQRIINNGCQEVIFIIGGSNGLSPPILKRADQRISFSPMTFPHQLMRVILCEQMGRVLGSRERARDI